MYIYMGTWSLMVKTAGRKPKDRLFPKRYYNIPLFLRKTKLITTSECLTNENCSDANSHCMLYKFSLSGALTLLLDLRSCSTGEGSVIELGTPDSGDSAEEQAALSGEQGHCWYCALHDWLYTKWSQQLEHRQGRHPFRN